MASKPFKPPLLKSKPSLPNIHIPPEEPPPKRRRVSEEDSDVEATTTAAAWAAAAPRNVLPIKTFIAHRTPLKDVGNLSQASEKQLEEKGPEAYYTVLWRKFTTRKNKTWDGDGVLSVVGGYARLQDVDGRDLGKMMWKLPLLPGSSVSLGGKEIEIDSLISKEDFLAGKPFLGGKPPIIQRTATPSFRLPKMRPSSQKSSDGDVIPTLAASQPIVSKFKKHALQRDSSSYTRTLSTPLPRHDPEAPDALVLERPSCVPKGRQIVDVVLDPFLARHLRPHQRDGVRFLYECVMGMRESGEGAILADEMGLGKTLQTIALLWTLLKQNPVYEDAPVVKKAMIVCPVTLISNWRAEFKKWLGLDRIGVFVVDNDKKIKLTDFTMGKAYSVMIIGYEKLRSVQEDLKKGAPIDIVIADEGHRLKTAQNKSAQAIKGLNTNKRIILSGTPLQNDLSEFFTMVDFVNPGLLGKASTFKREFETPILQSRVPNATERNKEKGSARSLELAKLTSQFILRRTSDVIAKFLPPKTEVVLFIEPTPQQTALYRAILESPMFGAVLGSTEASLQLINYLKKLCNSPKLLAIGADDSPASQNMAAMLNGIPADLINGSPGAKLQILENLLLHLKSTNQEKIVLVSNYTSTLDIIGQLLTSLSLPYLRLDGSTPAVKRQPLVDRFNRSSPSNYFAFLLSAKAGGAGINLIGASRLVLFDVDWNPATDLQAMARIHRDGQAKPCYIYRFLIRGAMDEKIFMRQVTKTGLADAVVDAKKTGQHFTQEELRALFRLDEDEGCASAEYLVKAGFATLGAQAAGISADHHHGISKTGRWADEEEMLTTEEEDEIDWLQEKDELQATDQILRGVVDEMGERMRFIFAKTTG